ncbi:MAG: RNA-binding transcriptional accessory protein [Lachnospiraceae bacterium]|nr:RNA-binding transcriptional accessory protein [Lachnospiraceae bacterium]
MDIAKLIAAELKIKPSQAETVIKLIDEGNTIPFIARYRKEMHGGLNDEVLRALEERLNYLRNLQERKDTVLASIEEQGKLNDELRKAIEDAMTLVAVEDLYRPYKQKRRTRAMIAKEKGLEGLAVWLFLQHSTHPATEEAKKYLNEEKGVATVEEALAGAKDIIAEEISDDASCRAWIRNISFRQGILVSEAKDKKADSVYEMYYDFKENVAKMAGYRTLAINRGEKEKILTVKIETPEDEILSYLEGKTIRGNDPETAPYLKESCEDAYRRLIKESIERDIRNELTEKAEDGAIEVFRKNLNQLLMQPPISGRVVLGWDPAFRTGCKLAVVDETGKVLDTKVVYPTAPQNKVKEAKKDVEALIAKYGVSLISVGNGTASRESEQVITEIIKEIKEPVQYVITNEAGASVYSASKLASEEFPNYDVGQRSAASIARRLQDPLAELVKIDPASIGVGQYQHDMNQKKLGEALRAVVEDCVNRVGVDLNTASASLLEYVSGINHVLAKNIVSYREEHGSFASRKELLKVPRLGPKAFEQCAGFMRILNAADPLDGTSVHPESYEAAKKLIAELGYSVNDLSRGGLPGIAKAVKDTSKLAADLELGELTLSDILKELEKPGRDPREDMPKPILRSDVLSMEDLTVGMVLKGTVRNVIDFGAFVDIGVHQDGLVHISQMSKKFIRHPLEVVSVGDIVEVKVIGIEPEKKRISLSLI